MMRAAMSLLGAIVVASSPAAAASPASLVPVDLVWSAHPVRFGLAANEDLIVVAYYDAARQLSLASRPRRDAAGWRYHKLASWTGWDSHNALSVAIDREGYIHVIGNLHNDPLLYFRSEAPGDIRQMPASIRPRPLMPTRASR